VPLPKSIAAYADCEEHFERALGAARGLAITLATSGEAHNLRHKMNTYRERLRKQSRLVYPEGDPRHGVSPYDHFKLTIDKENPCRILITEHRIDVMKVEEL